MARILVVDDEALMRDMAAETLRRGGHEVRTATRVAEALPLLVPSPDLVLTDLRMPGRSGIDLLREARAKGVECPFLVMTAHGSVRDAVEAMRLGALDFLEKPFELEVLEMAVARALEVAGLRRENRRLREELGRRYRMIGGEGGLSEVMRNVAEVAPARTTVLVHGESGTGKELVARALHAGSPRADGPFVKVNCAALPESLVESELFGHEKGAFTGAMRDQKGKFELADGGTLLLDEISEMPLHLQAKLLRVLQEREVPKIGAAREIPVDVRLVCTTNRDLRREVSEGRFREDLWFRLAVIVVRMPTLRERMQDLPSLVTHFLARFNAENGSSVEEPEEAAWSMLRAHSWPGNVRELENAIHRGVVLSRVGPLRASTLGIEPSLPTNASSALLPGGVHLPLGTTVAEAERVLSLATLTECGGNRTRAAERLGISIRTLRNKLHQWGAAGSEDSVDE